jgi:hypothetical protein
LVSVDARPVKEMAQLSIKDIEIRIAKEDMENVFEEFK